MAKKKKRSETKAEMDKVRSDRQVSYGDPHEMSKMVAGHWTQILRAQFPNHEIPDVPPHLVGVMMAALKLHRLSCPFPKDEDSYVDLHNYVEFAREMDPTVIVG